MSSGKGHKPPPEWSEHLTVACKNLEADFYFEKGASYAFVYALYQVMRIEYVNLQIGVTEGFAHAALLYGDMGLDHHGEINKKNVSKYRPLKHPRDICAVALAGGQSQDQFDEDVAWAKQVIECAKDLYEENIPQYQTAQTARISSLRV